MLLVKKYEHIFTHKYIHICNKFRFIEVENTGEQQKKLKIGMP